MAKTYKRNAKKRAPFSRHQELMLCNRRRTFCDEGELEMIYDPLYCRVIGDKGDDSHLALTLRAEEGGNFIDTLYYLRPAFVRDWSLIFLCNLEIAGHFSGLAVFSSMASMPMIVEEKRRG